MKIENFKLLRDSYSDKNTLGIMLRNGKHLGFTLEDPVRAGFMKIFGKTAVRAMTYELVVKMSPKYKEERVYLKAVNMFTGVQIHNGNSEKDTLGCILLNNHICYKNRSVWGGMKDDILAIVKAADRSFLEIVNLPQNR